MRNTSEKLLKSYFSFLFSGSDFQLKEIKSYGYALYAKFSSYLVGIYFIYEFRDSIPQIQFTLLN